MPFPVPALMKAFGFTRNKLNKLRDAGHLSSKIQDGSPGVPAIVSRDVALEIALMSVAIGAGYDPADAKIRVREWLRLHKEKGLDHIWVFDPMAGLLASRSMDGDKTIKDLVTTPRHQIEMPLGSQNRASMTLRVFNLGEVFDRLDEIEREYKQIASM